MLYMKKHTLKSSPQYSNHFKEPTRQWNNQFFANFRTSNYYTEENNPVSKRMKKCRFPVTSTVVL